MSVSREQITMFPGGDRWLTRGRLAERFERHYTPKHGSWLDMAESEVRVLWFQRLDRRIPDKQTLINEIAAWEDERNANHAKANWKSLRQAGSEVHFPLRDSYLLSFYNI